MTAREQNIAVLSGNGDNALVKEGIALHARGGLGAPAVALIVAAASAAIVASRTAVQAASAQASAAGVARVTCAMLSAAGASACARRTVARYVADLGR